MNAFNNNFQRVADLIAADDRRVMIAPLSQVVRLQTVKAGLHVTIGVPVELMGPLSRGELSGGLLLVDPAALKDEEAPAAPESPSGELQKFAASHEARKAVNDFLDWCEEQGLCLASFEAGKEWPRPLIESRDQMLHRYLGIDPQALERERRALLVAARAATAPSGWNAGGESRG